VNGVEAAGSRETVVLNAGVAGNDHPLSIVREYWFSSRLGINLVEKRSDPRFGTQTFTVSGIVLQEPDPQFFTVPAGYRTPKMRSAQVSSSGSAPH
jgi:hypothetical protein